MKNLLYDARWIGNHGIGRFADELGRRLSGLSSFQRPRRPWHPLDPILLGSELWSRSPDLFFSPGYNSPVGWPGKFIFTLHDLNHLRVPDNSSALKRAYYRYVIRPACRKATFVLTVSEYSRREIANWANISEEKIINVRNGVGPPFGANGRRYDPGYPYLLYVGNRKPHKNLPRLLRAYALSGIAKELLLVISGAPDQNTVADVRRLELSDRVIFLPLDSTELLADAYRGATAFLFPSLYEGFGLPPLEAMACAIPVLTSKVCSLPEVVGDAAVLVNPLDVEEIAHGIRLIVNDSALRKRLQDGGPRQANKFSWEETARRTSVVLAIAVGAQTGASELRRRRDESFAD
ncbi:MAG: glycosyltransferase family 4 protein [Acidobacteriia bacterium]|nr:glycosyltransferase family 4 protein [Terriglobia bacterium]